MFINELEKLGIVWSTTGFEASDKADIIRILLMKGNPHAVQIAAAMGYVFKLTNTSYWDQILQLMTSFSMVLTLIYDIVSFHKIFCVVNYFLSTLNFLYIFG